MSKLSKDGSNACVQLGVYKENRHLELEFPDSDTTLPLPYDHASEGTKRMNLHLYQERRGLELSFGSPRLPAVISWMAIPSLVQQIKQHFGLE